MTSTTKPKIANCSFCGKADTEIAKLVAGPGVFICNECVALAAMVIEQSNAADAAAKAAQSAQSAQAAQATQTAETAQAAEPSPAPVAPWEADMPLETVLTSITKIAATGAQTDQNLRLFVAKARDLGATWTQIGASLGIARQSAWERFSGEE